MKHTRRWLLSLTFIVSATGLGCGRAHLSSHYAQSYVAWFTAQSVKPKSSEEARKIIESLDAPEAAAVSKNYRKTRGGEDASGSRMLMIGAPRSGGGPESYMPAASSIPQ
ncbi:MAG TPA: hypothetical protein VIQ54_21185 [Polyangia bacterium]